MQNRFLKFIVKRLLAFIPLLLGITIVTFILIRLIPGDPAQAMAGSTPYEGVVEGLREHLGLNKPLYEQYFIYMKNMFHGDWGTSWFSGKPVLDDLKLKLPATLELITYGIIFSVIIGLFLGIAGAVKPGGVIDKLASGYGLLAGALPDFWISLLVILFLFNKWHLVPAPTGRFPLIMTEPKTVTGFLTIDALIAGDFKAYSAAVKQLISPVLTLVLIYAGTITKMTRSTMIDALHGPTVNYARACGLPESKVIKYAFKKILPPVITLIGFIYAQMVGGAVLVEKVFSWNGIGRYAVQAIINKDYSPVQGFVLVAAVISLLVYLLVDILYMVVDPRVKM